MSEARCMKPSTFATRKEQTAPVGKRLVSLGKSDRLHRVKGGDVRVVEMELFANLDRMVERFVKFPGQPLVALQDNSEPADRVTSLPPSRNRRISRPNTSAYLESLPEPAPRPV